ncbi:hypothetical protein Patl_1410 [Paraglaciecola sp. T6c]|uniref:hypothetical protein n=1 Tax=Pseudoalteromonas atlantica (strain T6c / ATCC BAA-1087) TaxID=3042615 RepID=UPI00005C64CD|nr:hypothetical protein [Paraglaciecola sp. T6c]ABG39935.1 hypothetical protein Patl_1410 [Paraglaciecola sp. T6c]
MKILSVALLATISLVTLNGCTDKAVSLPYLIHSDDIVIAANDRTSAIEIAKILQLTSLEPVQHDELDCEKGPSHIAIKKKGSLQDAFDDLVDEGWDCVLILD